MNFCITFPCLRYSAPIFSRSIQIHTSLFQKREAWEKIVRQPSGTTPDASGSCSVLEIVPRLEDSKITVILLIDFSNVFNVVNHDILLVYLSRLYISPQWFSCQLRDRKKVISVNQKFSRWCDLGAGPRLLDRTSMEFCYLYFSQYLLIILLLTLAALTTFMPMNSNFMLRWIQNPSKILPVH